MPRKDVWIRKADIDKWEAVKNKSEFIHLALNRTAVAEEPAKIEKHQTFFKDKKLNT